MTEIKADKNSLSKKIAKMSYEQALSRLEEVVEEISSKQVNLDNMVDLYEEGKVLHLHCKNLLDKAKMKVEEVN